MALRILLADDQRLVREGIKALLAGQKDLEVVGEAADGNEAIGMARKLRPDVILMDLHMPMYNGIEATRLIRAEWPEIKIIILTDNENDHHLFEAIRQGVHGYLLKSAEPAELVAAVHGVARGEASISPALARKIINNLALGVQAVAGDMLPANKLTARESEVLRMVAKGLTNREIAQELFISENTVKNHLRNIMNKLHCRNRAQAIAFGLRAGIVQRQDIPKS